MKKQDSLLLTPIINENFWSMAAVERIAFSTGADTQLKANQAQLAKVLKHRLDRPELRKKIQEVLDTAITVDDNCKVIPKIDQILALIPDEEEAKKQERERILDILEFVFKAIDDKRALMIIRQALKGEK